MGSALFRKPEIYDYCEEDRITYFIRLKSNPVLQEFIEPDLRRPVWKGRSKSAAS